MAELPVNLWAQAFLCLDAQDFLKASTSSKRLHDVSEDEDTWCFLACRRWPQVELYSTEELRSAVADAADRPMSESLSCSGYRSSKPDCASKPDRASYRLLYKHLATDPLQSRRFTTVDAPRIFCFFAAAAPIAVILVRMGIRGEASGSWKQRCRLWQMVRWDLTSNSFQRGQFVRLIIRPDMCCLSPDGEHFIYVGAKYRSHFARSIGQNSAHGDLSCSVYMVLSRPPYFSAVALWEPNDAMYDGFHHNGKFDLQNTSCGCAAWDSQTALKIGLYHMPPTIGSVHSDVHVTLGRRNTPEILKQEQATYAASGEFELPSNDGAWRHPQFHQREVFYAQQGKLLMAQPVEQGGLRHIELLDFTGDEFVQLAPPEWAKRWGFEVEGKRP